MTAGTVLHVAPHPDDELLGAPAALTALGDAGWRVVNLAAGPGGGDQRARRRAELVEACDRIGFELVVATTPVDDPPAPGPTAATEAGLAAEVVDLVGTLGATVVVAPTPVDRHPGHELVGRAVRAAVARLGDGVRLWQWALWGELPRPTLLVPMSPARLDRVVRALDAHAGELDRNDYRRLVRGRAETGAVLGPELVFGFGTGPGGWRSGGPPAGPGDGVELLCELIPADGRWWWGTPRWLDPGDPLTPHGGADAGPLHG